MTVQKSHISFTRLQVLARNTPSRDMHTRNAVPADRAASMKWGHSCHELHRVGAISRGPGSNGDVLGKQDKNLSRAGSVRFQGLVGSRVQRFLKHTSVSMHKYHAVCSCLAKELGESHNFSFCVLESSSCIQ